MAKTPADILKSIEHHGVTMLDFRFADPSGAWRVVSLPAKSVDEELLARGVPWEGTLLNDVACDAILRPDPGTARIDALRGITALSLICDVEDAGTKTRHEHDPRGIARRAAEHLRSTGVADAACFAPKAGFLVVDGFERVAAAEGERLNDLRREMTLELDAWGVAVEMRHRGLPTPGRAESAFGFKPLVDAADDLMTFKHVVKDVAARHGRAVTFMPKPFVDDPGSALPCRQTLRKNGKSIFLDPAGYAACSRTMLQYIGGLLTHAPAILAFSAPATNSYKRLAARPDGPFELAFSARNPSATAFVPSAASGDPKAKHVEFRACDTAANPYLAFSAMVLAGLDGIKRQIDPVKAGFGPLDRRASEASPGEPLLRPLPVSLGEALDALAADHAFLLQGDAFTESFIGEWIGGKREREVRPLEARPHPYELALYFGS